MKEEKRRAERRRHLVIMIQRFMADHGYSDAVACLATASGVSLEEYDVGDNIDLMMVVQVPRHSLIHHILISIHLTSNHTDV